MGLELHCLNIRSALLRCGLMKILSEYEIEEWVSNSCRVRCIQLRTNTPEESMNPSLLLPAIV